MDATNSIVANQIIFLKSQIEDYQRALCSNRERASDLYSQMEAIEWELTNFGENFQYLDPESIEYQNYVREEADLIIKCKSIELDLDRLRKEEFEYMKCIHYYEDELSKIEHFEIN